MQADLGQLNIGLASAWRKAAICDDWRHIVHTAMLHLKQNEHKLYKDQGDDLGTSGKVFPSTVIDRKSVV